jgi:trehalose/maltose hydrolase-like predicted phosphorylase
MRNPRQTFGTISGFFDCQATTPETNFEELRSRGCESIISGIPHSLGFHLVAGNQVLNSTVDEKTVSNFTQTMSYQDGVVQWKYTWAPRNMSVRFDVEMTSFMHRTRPNVAASELRVTPRGGNCNVSIVDLIDGRSAVRSSLGEKGMSDSSDTFRYVSNHPEGLPTVTAWTLSKSNVSNGYTVESSRRATAIETSSDMSIGQEWDVALVDEETAVFQKFIGLATSDKFVDPRSTAIFESHEAFVGTRSSKSIGMLGIT